MKMMALPILRACWNKSRTRLAPTPTNISMKSEPVTDKKPTPASPATARANKVLPVPGGPTSNIPLGTFAPISLNRSGMRRKSTTSLISVLTPSYPAMSAKVVDGRSALYALARLRPMDIMLPIWPEARLFIHTKKPMTKMNGKRRGMRFITQFDCGVFGLKSTPWVRRSARSCSLGNPGGAVVENELPSVKVPVMVSVALLSLTSSTLPLVTWVMNSSKPNFSRSGPGRS